MIYAYGLADNDRCVCMYTEKECDDVISVVRRLRLVYRCSPSDGLRFSLFRVPCTLTQAGETSCR